MKNPLKVPLFAALDVDDGDKAIELAKSIKPYVGAFKIGPRLLMRYGADFISEIAHIGPVFVDNKYHDIPNTLEYSVRATFEAGASFTTVHASSGFEALKQLAAVEAELNKDRFFKILVVTVLTSLCEKTLPPNWQKQPVIDHVNDLAQMAMDAGLSGLVCSAHEVSKLREKFPDAFLLTPGIRFMNEGQGDQKRVMSPQQAMEAGSSALVVGRPIYRSEDPVAAAKSYYVAISDEEK